MYLPALLLSAVTALPSAQPPRRPAVQPDSPAPFKTPLTAAQMANKPAVVQTTAVSGESPTTRIDLVKVRIAG